MALFDTLISVGRNGQKMAPIYRLLFVPKLIFVAFLEPLGSRQSQSGGVRMFTPLDHLLMLFGLLDQDRSVYIGNFYCVLYVCT